MKKIYLSLILLFIGVSSITAQTSQNPGEVFIQQASFDHNEAAKRFTSDFVTMFDMDFDAFDSFNGQSNTAIVNQFGNSNITGVKQTGWGNMGMVNILGNNNNTGLTQQGTGNQFILNLEGNDNQLLGEQTGSQNQLRIDRTGSSRNQSFTQTGSDLSLQLIDNGSGGIPLQIEQKGNGASAIIENY